MRPCAIIDIRRRYVICKRRVFHCIGEVIVHYFSHIGVFKLILCGNSRMDQYIVSRTSNRRGIVRWTTETDLLIFENSRERFQWFNA